MQPAEIKKLLLEIKTETHLTQKQIAERIGTGRTFLSDIASGRSSLSPEMLDKLLALLPCDISRKYKTISDEAPTNHGGKNSQVIKNNSGTTINGDNAVVHPQEGCAVFQRMQNQIDELIAQNGKLLNIIDRLTSK